MFIEDDSSVCIPFHLNSSYLMDYRVKIIIHSNFFLSNQHFYKQAWLFLHFQSHTLPHKGFQTSEHILNEQNLVQDLTLESDMG